MKRTNEDEKSEELVEGRGATEGKPTRTSSARTRSRKSENEGLRRLREAVRRDRKNRLTALLHHVTPELLRASYYKLKRSAAPGVDGVTWEKYSEGLEDRLRDLHRRIHQETYRTRPSRRVHIPKEDGRRRALGIRALEDKIVEQAVRTVLEVIYEEEFKGFSYGYRPGRSQHQALEALWTGLMQRPVNWVLDADISGFFDRIDHEWLLKMLEHRIGDRRILRLIRMWLKAGILEEQGEWEPTEQGTPQGAVISPLLGNIYLHHVLDQWSEAYRKGTGKGAVMIVRYADDFVVGFQRLDTAQEYRQQLTERLGRFGLELNEKKTRLIAFGREAARDRRTGGGKGPGTFSFLGFRHICGKDRKGRFLVQRKTLGKRLRRSLKKLRRNLRRHRHEETAQQGRWIQSVVRGFLNYHAVAGNSQACNSYRSAVHRAWLRSLRRRSQKHRMTWDRFRRLAARWIPSVEILHPYPFHRLTFDPK